MATWFTITFEGEPTEADFRRVAELAAQGCTSGQLINEPGAEDEEGPATGYYASTARWFEESKRLGCTGTGYNEDDDTIEHRDPGPCPVHPGL